MIKVCTSNSCRGCACGRAEPDMETQLFVFEALRDLLDIQDMPEDELGSYPEGMLTEIADEAWEKGRQAIANAREKGTRG